MLASHWGDEKKIFFFSSPVKESLEHASASSSLSLLRVAYFCYGRAVYDCLTYSAKAMACCTHTHTHPFSAKEHCRSSSSLFTSPFGPVPKDLNSFIMAALRVMFIPFSLGSSLCELLPFFFFFSWMFLFLSLSLRVSLLPKLDLASFNHENASQAAHRTARVRGKTCCAASTPDRLVNEGK